MSSPNSGRPKSWKLRGRYSPRRDSTMRQWATLRTRPGGGREPDFFYYAPRKEWIMPACRFAISDIIRGVVTHRLMGWSKTRIAQDVDFIFDLIWKGIAAP